MVDSTPTDNQQDRHTQPDLTNNLLQQHNITELLNRKWTSPLLSTNLAMINDPIVEEIRGFRAAHAAKYGNNLDRIFEAIKASEAKSKRKLVNLGPKRLPLKKTWLAYLESGAKRHTEVLKRGTAGKERERSSCLSNSHHARDER